MRGILKKLRDISFRGVTRKWWPIGLSILVIGLIGVAFLRSRPQTNSVTFQDSLKTLVANIEGLQSALTVPEAKDINSDLPAYQARLDGLDKSCRDLGKTRPPDSTTESKAAVERIKGICEDLTVVTHHSRLLHERIHDYLLIEAAEWPKPGTPEFASRLENTNKIMADARYGLEGLAKNKVEDPALPELIYQVKFAQDIANKIKNAGNNPDEARKQAEELRLQLARDKTDFLAARQYFWNNTIGIAKLHKALTDIQASLNRD
ncbi:MAG: hypothetical protein V4702_01100 [Patescibacteria group bacterium]